jgi:hypothetical protein
VTRLDHDLLACCYRCRSTQKNSDPQPCAWCWLEEHPSEPEPEYVELLDAPVENVDWGPAQWSDVWRGALADVRDWWRR